MLSKNIKFINFKIKKKEKEIGLKLKSILNENNQVIQSLKKTYKDSYNKKSLKSLDDTLDYRIIGMGGSTLGTQAIYDFLKKKIKKKFSFIDNLYPKQKLSFNKSYNNLIVSKSGNTIETIVNLNTLIKKKIKIFLLQKIKTVI